MNDTKNRDPAGLPAQAESEYRPKMTRVDLQTKYPDIMALPPGLRDEIAAKALEIMVRRGECKPYSKVTGRLITRGNERERYMSYLKELELYNNEYGYEDNG